MDHGLGAMLAMLALGLPVALLMQRLGTSALVAYLVAGALAGPGALGWVQPAQLQPLAEVGAALLLFAIGLEFDLAAIARRWRPVTLAATVQIALTVLAGAGVAVLAGFTGAQGVALGACLAMTSTILLMRVLDERGLTRRPDSQLALGLSLMQDIAVGPLLVLLAFLMPVHHRPDFAWIVGGMLLCAGATVLLRRVLAALVFRRIRAAGLPELEVALSVTVALGAALLTDACGLGAAAGAFCAGLAFGGDASRQAVESSMRPLQGLFAIVFFMAIGALFDPRFAWDNAGAVTVLLIAGLAIKIPLAGFALRLAGLPVRAALGFSLALAPIGEFAFVLAAGAFADSTDPAIQHLYRLVATVTAISLASAPLLLLAAKPLLPKGGLAVADGRGDTIVVAGLGPVGNSVVGILRDRGHPLLLVDRNERLLAAWQDTPGIRLHRGRIEDLEDWLPILGHRPSLIVLAFPVADTSAIVARRLRQAAPDLVILARAPYQAQIDTLAAAGAQCVLCDETATTAALGPVLAEALLLARRSAPAARMDSIDKSTDPPSSPPHHAPIV
jgi:monovalent cation:H+ antiporter-2, CPA2 family